MVMKGVPCTTTKAGAQLESCYDRMLCLRLEAYRPELIKKLTAEGISRPEDLLGTSADAMR